MARKSNNPTAVAESTPAPATGVETAQAQAAERSALILQQFGDGLPFDLPRYEHVIRTHLSRSAEEMLAAGRALLVVREHVPHGEWLESLRRLGLDQSVAYRMSQAALKFSNHATSHDLIAAAGNKSKLFELLVLDDEEVAELNHGGTVAGLTLDDVANMSVSDLRKALREARAEAKANETLLEEKGRQIDQLKKDVRRIRAEDPDKQLKGLYGEVSGELTHATSILSVRLREGLGKIRELGAERGENALQHASQVTAGLRLLQQQIDELIAEYELPDESAAPPAWAGRE